LAEPGGHSGILQKLYDPFPYPAITFSVVSVLAFGNPKAPASAEHQNSDGTLLVFAARLHALGMLCVGIYHCHLASSSSTAPLLMLDMGVIQMKNQVIW
jgi:hypothetical protein